MLSSLVDYKNETKWADQMRAKGVKVGFIGITASKMPELFVDHCDFILNGDPEAGVMRIAQGILPSGIVVSEGGDAELQDELFQGFGTAMRNGLTAVYIVLAVLFASLLQPLTIMFSLPLSVAGATNSGVRGPARHRHQLRQGSR